MGRLVLPTILIDTREQMPYEFIGNKSRIATIPTGDYSIEGCETRCAVERKSKSDAYGCVGGERQRFVGCLQRLKDLPSAAIVVESSLDDFSSPPPYTRLTAAQAVGTFISWSQEYRIPIFFCPNRAYAERVTLRWLQAFWRHKQREAR